MPAAGMPAGAGGSDQERLRAEFLQRIGRAVEVRPDDARDLAELAETAAAQSDLAAVVAVREPRLPSIVAAALRFARDLPDAVAHRWLRGFTRTLFLVGNPTQLRDRFSFAQVAADRCAAWFGPAPMAASTGLRRLLRPVPSTGQVCLPERLTVTVPATGGALGAGGPVPAGRIHELWLATQDLSWADYLVHLHHSLAEPALTGLLAAGDQLAIRHAPRLTGWPAGAAYRRVHFDRQDPSRLRLYSTLVPLTGTHADR